MEITRSYYNSSELIRIDKIYMRQRSNFGAIIRYQEPTPKFIYIRKVVTTRLNSTGTTRTVDAIEVIGDYDTIEASTGDYAWASLTVGDSSIIRVDMSDLPGIGDTV